MKTFEIKFRCFPPPDEYHHWTYDIKAAEEDPHHQIIWEFSEDVEYVTEYLRPIVDEERNRQGFSAKLIVSYDSEYDYLPPELWDWQDITGLEADRFEFIRAKEA